MAVVLNGIQDLIGTVANYKAQIEPKQKKQVLVSKDLQTSNTVADIKSIG